jgi:hypothetical protein
MRPEILWSMVALVLGTLVAPGCLWLTLVLVKSRRAARNQAEPGPGQGTRPKGKWGRYLFQRNTRHD